MDASYWASLPASDRASVSAANVVEVNQPCIMPYSGVEVIPAASLEALINQQRLAGAPGFSLLPYPGAVYTAQVIDDAVAPVQALLPGAYTNVTTTAVEAQPPYLASTQPVMSACRSVGQVFGDRSTTVANALPVLSGVNPAATGRSSMPLKQPLQTLNLSELLDYSSLIEHGMADVSGTIDLRNPALLANMLQSLNAASLPSSSCSNERNTEVSQPLDVREFSVVKQALPSRQQPQQEVQTVHQQNLALLNHQLSAGASYANPNIAPSNAAVLQASEPKGNVPYGGVVWPSNDQVLISDKLQSNGTVPICQSMSLNTAVSSSSVQVSYEAVSPPSGNVDSTSLSLLDSLPFTADTIGGYHWGSLLGSTVDTSALFAATPQKFAYVPQQSKAETWSAKAASSPYTVTANAKLQRSGEIMQRSTLDVPLTTSENIANRQSVVELDKMQKQKSNLGIVLPMTHSSGHAERNNISSQASTSCRTSVIGDMGSAVELQGQNSLNNPLSVEKSTGPVMDTATGGIVLTNITGNVYVNQYTMLPGGAQPLDNALLHADYATGSGPSSLSYDGVADESTYSLPIPSVAVMVNSEEELGNFPAMPACSIPCTQPNNNTPHIVSDTPPMARKLPAAESSFFGVEAAPVLAAKPSNKFESCFLQFICGHKAETLSSVLNSPIKTRPILPKYIPETRRPTTAAAEPAIIDSNSKTETKIDSGTVTACSTATTPSVLSTSVTATDTATSTSVSKSTAEWPAVTKLPAKFSHKWKNRTSLSASGVSPPPTTSTTSHHTVPKAIEVSSSKSLKTSVDVLPSSSGGKTKCQSTKWTVSKKSKCSSSQSSGVPVLVLKAVPVANSRSSTSASKISR